MKKLYLAALCVESITLAAVAHAESRQLPPIINNSTYADGASYSSQASSNQPMLEMLGRMDALQTEVQQLRGMLEQQGHEINNLQQRQKNIYSDINTRLQALETGAGIALSTSSPATSTMATPVASKKTTEPVKTKQIQVKQSYVKPAQVKSSPVKVVKPASKADEKAAFDKAFMSVKNSHYQQAIKQLEQFLQDYPDGSYSDNAHFWLGSVYKVVNNIPAAKVNFQAVYTQFPKSEKAAMAMLKLADIYKEDNNTAKAQQLYTEITTQYADSTAADMAKKKLQNIGQ